MNVSGLDRITSRLDAIVKPIEANADVLGGFYGILLEPTAGGRGLSGATMTFMMNRLKNWKFPDISKLIDMISNRPIYRDGLWNSILMIFGGWISKEIGEGIHPLLTRLGNAVQSAGVGMLAGTATGAFLWLPSQQTETTEVSEPRSEADMFASTVLQVNPYMS